jgi:glutamate-5-semialdehyde dehydrogenase
VDLIIPRGSNAFVRYVQDNTRIPVLGHADGICHLYVDAAADFDQAITIAVDAKAGYPSACNAIETLLVHRAIAADFLPQIAQALEAQSVSLRGDSATQTILPQVTPATVDDWSTEYSDLILAIRVVDSLDMAITHINTYGSRHTEAIATTDAKRRPPFAPRSMPPGFITTAPPALPMVSAMALGRRWASAPRLYRLGGQWG